MMPSSISPVQSNASSGMTNALVRQGAAGPGGALGRDEFLQLLTAQLRYQDPMNPMDGHQLAADLAQFSGLEQLLDINEQLKSQQDSANVLLSAINNSVALGTMGKTVIAAGDHVVLADDGNGTIDGTIIADIGTAGTATLELLNSNGVVIGRRVLGPVAKGDQQSFTAGAAASGLTPGLYHARIVVNDTNGAGVPQTTYFTGKVDGLSYAPGGAVLTSGPVDIAIGSIRRIIG
jgi:flagellar basal-body rod modification protein FlgD